MLGFYLLIHPRILKPEKVSMYPESMPDHSATFRELLRRLPVLAKYPNARAQLGALAKQLNTPALGGIRPSYNWIRLSHVLEEQQALYDLVGKVRKAIQYGRGFHGKTALPVRTKRTTAQLPGMKEASEIDTWGGTMGEMMFNIWTRYHSTYRYGKGFGDFVKLFSDRGDEFRRAYSSFFENENTEAEVLSRMWRTEYSEGESVKGTDGTLFDLIWMGIPSAPSKSDPPVSFGIYPQGLSRVQRLGPVGHASCLQYSRRFFS